MMNEITAPGPRVGLVATIVGMVADSGAAGLAGVRTVEAAYRLTWAGWQLESIRLVGPDGKLIAGRFSADGADDGALSETPPLALTWAEQHNPGNFDALATGPDAVSQRARATAAARRRRRTEGQS